MIIERSWKPCVNLIKMSHKELFECYEGQIVNQFGYEFDLEQSITEVDYIIHYMMDYWDHFVVPIADHIILRMMTERLQ